MKFGFGAVSNGLFVVAGVLSLLDHLSEAAAPPTPRPASGGPGAAGPPMSVQQATWEYLKRTVGPDVKPQVKNYDGVDKQGRINIMVKLINDYAMDPYIYTSASRIATRLGGRERLRQAQYIHKLLADNVEYVNDRYGRDTFQSVLWTLALGRGDCDDFTIAACTLAMSMGLPCRIKTIWTLVPDAKNGGRTWEKDKDWGHVYALFGVRTPLGGVQWIPCDPTVKGGGRLGYEANSAFVVRSEEYDAATGQLERRWENPKLA